MATIRKLRKRWQAMVRRKGVPPRAKSFDKRSDAERWARELEAEVDRSGWIADTRLAERVTLGELLTRYSREITPTKRSAMTEQHRLNGMIRRDICHRAIAKLTSSDLARYRDDRLASVSPATVVRELNTISHALDIAQREWGFWLPRNPAKQVRRPNLPNGRKRRLEAGEEQALLDACDRGRTPLLRPLIILAVQTGMRRGELLGLLWQHVDFQRRVAHLPLTKNGEARDIPLSQLATATLRTLAANPSRHRERVFPMTGNAVRLAFEHLRSRAGIKDLRFHDLRHEAISRLFEKGLNVAEVSAISGHKELRMLARYTHLRAVDLVHRLG
jgi:integrase